MPATRTRQASALATPQTSPADILGIETENSPEIVRIEVTKLRERDFQLLSNYLGCVCQIHAAPPQKTLRQVADLVTHDDDGSMVDAAEWDFQEKPIEARAIMTRANAA